MKTIKLAAALAAAIVAALAPAAAQARTTTETRTFHGVTATLSYAGTFPNYSHLHLRIVRGGTVLRDASVTSRACGDMCGPGALPGRSGSVHVVDLERNGTTDVIVDVFSGGAHCCSIEQVFVVSPRSHAVSETEFNFGDPGARLLDLRHNGRLDFLTANDAFAYKFTGYAGSGMPIEVLAFRGGRFVDITRRFHARIRKDAAEWLRIYRRLGATQHWQDTVGIIAAWAADEDMLGRKAFVARYLAKEARLGHLNSADPSTPSGARYVATLNRFLSRSGYLR